MAAAPAPKKLKILCLHGHMQNAVQFKGRLGFLRKAALARVAELSFVDGPHQVPVSMQKEGDADGPSEGAKLTWFRFDDSWRENAAGFDETVAALEEAFRREGPFDGLLGFSLGAVVCSVIATEEFRKRHPALAVRFVILCSGFRSPAHLAWYEAPSAVPSLHLWGTGDRHVGPQRSEDLARAFWEPQIEVSEGGGHVIPSKAKEAIAQFCQRFVPP